ncbi:MAG: hypothetical protein M3O93_09390, partial [Chloroflexota bacterium]|nr:hypothetical protein [Chloroflexota bacterium]
MSAVEPQAPPAAAPEDTDASGRGAAFTSPLAGGELRIVEPLLFAHSKAGRRDVRFPAPSAAARSAAGGEPALPEAA